MTNITVIYDVFSGMLRFLLDGSPIPGISRLSQFQKRPFADWCTQIFPVAYEEINDEYAMTYVGRGCESRMLAYYSRENSHCRSFSTKVPSIADSALKRLKKLHMLCMNGLMYRKFTKELVIGTDLPEQEVTELFKQSLPKLCYCSFQIRCVPLGQCASQRDLFCVLASETGGWAAGSTGNAPAGTHILRIAGRTCFEGIKDGCCLDAAKPEDLEMVLHDILEFRVFPELLQKAIAGIGITESHPQYYAFLALNKVEPITIPVFPLSMEFGQQKEIERRTIPEGYAQEELTYRVSSEEILQIKNHVMNAVGSGEVVVEAYRPGQNAPVATAHMKVVRRNRITSIAMDPQKVSLCVGETAKARYSYQPADADNVSTIRYQSANGLIAAIKENGEITARKPGATAVFAETDNRVRGECRVTVYPVLEKIEVRLEKAAVRRGEYIKVETKRVPESATLYPLIFRVEPQDVAEYDAGSQIIVSKKRGKAVLKVTDSRHSAETEVSFTVKKKGLFG